MAERVAIVGARGYTGAELVRLVEAHPGLELAWVGSRKDAGLPLGERVDRATSELVFEAPSPEAVGALDVAAVVLALPNGLSADYVACLGDEQVVVDLSADHRFDDAWVYGLPERRREALRGARRIANPGCYATAAQLALDPVVASLSEAPRLFGVSGYSGAGTTPSSKNDPERLRDNIMPYAPVGHLHEREVGRQIGRAVHFMPHVAPHFRGIAMTVDLVLTEPVEREALEARYRERYANEPLVQVSAEAPEVAANAGRHHAAVGGFAVAGRRAVVHATIDNLLKGAATQATQNLSLALGLDELAGIPLEERDA